MEFKILGFKEFEEYIEQFLNLYKKCFSGSISRETIKWRYFNNPFQELLVCVAIDNGKLVANYAASPCEIVVEGKIYKAAESLNTMTDPEYAGKGLFVSLANELYKHMKSLDYKIIFGFPNHLSNPTFIRKIGWQNIYEIPTLELTLSEFKNNLKLIDKVYVDNEFSVEYSKFKHENKKIHINKSHSYLKWRYYENPQSHYNNFIIKNEDNKVRSFLICKEYNEKLNIVDYFFNNNIDGEVLINQALKHAIEGKKEKVTLWSQIGTTEHLMLEKYGFRNKYPITYFGAKVLSLSDKYDLFYDYRNWLINMADDNVY